MSLDAFAEEYRAGCFRERELTAEVNKADQRGRRVFWAWWAASIPSSLLPWWVVATVMIIGVTAAIWAHRRWSKRVDERAEYMGAHVAKLRRMADAEAAAIVGRFALPPVVVTSPNRPN